MESRLIELAADSEYAVLPLFYSPPGEPAKAGVAGTGFLVNTDGYFITAAHVLESYKPNSAQLTAISKQRTGHGAGLWFEVIEENTLYDLALCKIPNYEVHRLDKNNPQVSDFPVSTLSLSREPIQQGQFIAMVGFPLGSWNAAVQLGNIAATQTVNPWLPGRPRELIQVSASGNRGNSGGPVISMRTGEVLGVVVQAVPAPLWATVDISVQQSSGIMLAAPAAWVLEIMERHQVKSEAHKSNENLGRGAPSNAE